MRRRRTSAVLAVATVLVFGSLLVAAVLHGLLVSGQADLDRLQQDIQTERAELAREKLELAHLQSPARIAAEATAIGMVPADQQHWLSPGTGDDPVVTGAPAPEAPADATDPDATDPADESDTDSPAETSELAGADGGAAAQ